MAELGWFVKFYEKTGLLGVLALLVGVVVLYFLKGIVDLVVQKIKAHINKPDPSHEQQPQSRRWNENITTSTVQDEDKLIRDAKESFIIRMDCCINDSISKLRPKCILKGVVFSHMLRLKMEENKRVGISLLMSYKEHGHRDAVSMAEVIVASLHRSTSDFEKKAAEDGVPTEIITKFLTYSKITEEATEAIAKRMCLVSLLDTNAKKIVSVVDVIATLAILNIVDYQETSEAFNGRAQAILQQALDTMKKDGKMYEMFKEADKLGCVYIEDKACKDCTGKKHE